MTNKPISPVMLNLHILLEDVEIPVGPDLEHFGADLHAGSGGCAVVEIDGDLHVLFPCLQ